MENQNKKNIPAQPEFSGESSLEYNMGEKDSKQKNRVKEILEYAESLTLVFAVMLLIFTFIARPATVDGTSMLPTLEDQERLVISNLFYEPKAGDIVVLCGEADKEEGRTLIKRIIATEGQTVDIDFEAGEVYVDGEKLSEPYILEPTYLDEGIEFPLTVPEGEIFVMGDNRNGSRDSRSTTIGTVKEEYIVGRTLFRFFPFDRFGKIGDTGRLNIVSAEE